MKREVSKKSMQAKVIDASLEHIEFKFYLVDDDEGGGFFGFMRSKDISDKWKLSRNDELNLAHQNFAIREVVFGRAKAEEPTQDDLILFKEVATKVVDAETFNLAVTIIEETIKRNAERLLGL